MALFSAFIICFCHYLNQLQTSILIIEKHVITKQQKQLHQFFQNQKQAIILYKFKNGHDDQPSASFSLEEQADATLDVPMSNPAVTEIL